MSFDAILDIVGTSAVQCPGCPKCRPTLYCRDGQVAVFPPNDGTRAKPCDRCSRQSVWHLTVRPEVAK